MQLKIEKTLISTGELKPAIILSEGNKVFSECGPSGSTTGSYEKPLQTSEDNKFIDVLNNSFHFPQKCFDDTIKCFGSELSVPASLIHWKYLNNDTIMCNTPKIILNLVNGGKHTGGSSVMAEFMIIPNGKSIKEHIDIAVKVWQKLGELLALNGQNIFVSGREGGYVTKNLSDEKIIGLIDEAICLSDVDCNIAIDVASNNFSEKKNNEYFYNGLPSREQLKYYLDLIKTFPRITYLEDPFNEDDFDGWKSLINANADILIVADDLTVTNVTRIKKYRDCFNGIILKPNQIGTVSELIDSFDKSFGAIRIMSQRSGETDSFTIVDLGLHLGVDMFKLGAPTRERIVKYNRLLIQETRK